MKVSFFSKYIIKKWISLVTAIISISSFLLIFFDSNCFQKYKLTIAIIITFVMFCIYIGLFIYYKNDKKITLVINNTIVKIFFGDIFKMPGKKIIAFNEYFDTIVDEKIITKKSLNGKLINNFLSAEKIDSSILEDHSLIKNGSNLKRKEGKQQKYSLGQIHCINDWFLLSFSRFNKKNEAELMVNEYATCLLEMWKNLNCKYAQNDIYIPLLGARITRIRDNMAIPDQDLLEIILSTLKISMVTFKEPSKINIVLYPGKANENISNFDFSRIKFLYKK